MTVRDKFVDSVHGVISITMKSALISMTAECVSAAENYPLPTPLDFQPILSTPARTALLPGSSGVWVGTSINCNRLTANVGCDIGNAQDSSDATPFTMEIVRTTTGFWYHQIIGDASSDYRDEMYIKGGGGHLGGDFEVKDVDGNVIGYECMSTCGSYSGGLHSSQSVTHSLGSDLARIGGNGIDPLNIDPHITGSGSGNPNFVLFRQQVKGLEIGQEFLKDQWLYKPKLTQVILSEGVRQDTRIDMSNSTYKQMDIAGDVTITTFFVDPFANDAAGFDSATDVQTSAISAGKYTYGPKYNREYWYLKLNGYTLGTPNDPNSCGDPAFRALLLSDPIYAQGGISCVLVNSTNRSGHDGAYTYESGTGFDPVNQQVNWMAYRNPDQNHFAADKKDAFACPATTDPSVFYYYWCPQP